jgi:hypothetical protein
MAGQYIPERIVNLPQPVKEQLISAELETGNRLVNVLKSDYGAQFHQTFKFFMDKLVVLTNNNSVMTCSHLTWQ